jgi:hypothetical protein
MAQHGRIPSNGEETFADVHAHGVALVEGRPEIGPDIDPIRACRRRIGIDFDLVPHRAAFWSTRDMNALVIDYGLRVVA